MSIGFNKAKLDPYLDKVEEKSGEMIKLGKKVVKDIDEATSDIKIIDPEVQDALAKVVTSLNKQAETLGERYKTIGGRVGDVGTSVKTFVDRATAVVGDGVTEVNGVYTIEPKSLDNLTKGTILDTDTKKPAPKLK